MDSLQSGLAFIKSCARLIEQLAQLRLAWPDTIELLAKSDLGLGEGFRLIRADNILIWCFSHTLDRIKR